MKVVGIDPGKTGGICYLDEGKQILFPVLPLDDERDWNPVGMAALCSGWRRTDVDLVVLEHVQFFPGNSAMSSATSVKAYGMWLGCIASAGLKWLTPTARQWKKEIGLPEEKLPRGASQADKLAAKARRKQHALVMARERFRLPFMTPKGRDKDGQAEAALLASWGILVSSKGVSQEELILEG